MRHLCLKGISLQLRGNTSMATLSNTNIKGSLIVEGGANVGGMEVLTLAPTYTFTKTINLAAANTWYDTGIIGTDMETGTYLMQILLDGKGSGANGLNV